jgi:hypothetical protein
MKPISATHVDSDGLVQPSRQIPAAITAHKFLDNADRIFTQPGPLGDMAVMHVNLHCVARQSTRAAATAS